MKPIPFVAVCMKDAEELREIAVYFDALGKKSNGYSECRASEGESNEEG